MAVLLHEKITDFFNNFWDTQGIDNAGENFGRFLTYPTVGIVVNVDDPLQMGRLQVFCPAYGDNPKKLLHLPWVAYASPFAGSIKNACYTRGVMDGPEHTTGAVHYGFWAIPEQGAHVIVSCLDADPRRRIYTACLPEHQETHTLLTGRYKWGEGGIPDGPLSSENSPIEPLYTNLGEAFQGDRESREWKTRGADYQPTAVREDVGEVPNDTKTTYLDQQYDKISEAEQDGWVKPILGSHGYDWTGLKGTGAFLSSRMYGWSTPGGHTFFMDDRPFNSRIKLRSATGHQVILDDTNERIYISTNKGKCWIEMDTCGNIDFFSEGRISMNTEKGFNFSTDDTFRVHAKKGIHLYSGNNISQEDLESIPNDGEIRIQAEDDMHLITNETLRWYSYRDSLFEIGGKKCESIGDSYYLHVENDIHTITNYGSYFLTISADINEIVNGNVIKYALGTMSNMSNENAEMYSFRGKMDIGSQKVMNMKSMSEDITLQSVGKNKKKSGAVVIKSPQSQYGVTSEGVFTATNKDIVQKAAKKIHKEIVETPQEDPTEAESPGDCSIGDTLPTDGYTGADLAARLAYNAGFRGADLVTAVAIAGGESSYNPNAVNNGDARAIKWGPSVGMWQIRTLQNPSEWSGLDRQRDTSIVGGAANAQNNANLAHQIYNRSGFREWGAFTNGTYTRHLDTATLAVQNMCGGGIPESMYAPHEELLQSFSSPTTGIASCGTSLLDLFLQIDSLLSNNTMQTLSADIIDIQANVDINFKSIALAISTKLFDDEFCDAIVPKINSTISKLNKLTKNITEYFAAKIAAGLTSPEAQLAIEIAEAVKFVAAVVDFVQNFSFDPLQILLMIADCGLQFNTLMTPNFKLPYFRSRINAVFEVEGHDLCTQIVEDEQSSFLESDIIIR